MTALLFFPTFVLLLLLLAASSTALPPPNHQFHITASTTTQQESLQPAWANDVNPASIHHNIHADQDLPVAEGDASIPVMDLPDQTENLPSAPTSLLPFLQEDW
ncbi:uncharacterized protein PV06_03407 [Exophiala oligosperma]|uniref:Uncharacterized protein n=1 Tax=Exophiala oligosperma TaxID=215243 RepID=A0A0D2DRF4_9EURO|nr:uncharacterized protein PV06_03407 [Exophiala oligosperma]KIW44980.1 hypothetical protein PV06_03407 [Exophiala oligosperma]